MTPPSWWCFELSSSTQYTRVWLDQSGLGSGETQISIIWIAICFTIHSNTYKHWIQTTSFSIFIAYSVALAPTQLALQPPQLWPPPAEMAPEHPISAPTHRMDGWQPPKPADVILGGVEGVFDPLSAPLFRRWYIPTTSECFEGHTHPEHTQKL